MGSDDLFRAIARDELPPDPSLARVVLAAADAGDAVAGEDPPPRAAPGSRSRRPRWPPGWSSTSPVPASSAPAASTVPAAPRWIGRSQPRWRPGCRLRGVECWPSPGRGAALLALDELGPSTRPFTTAARKGRSMTLMRDEIGERPAAIERHWRRRRRPRRRWRPTSGDAAGRGGAGRPWHLRPRRDLCAVPATRRAAAWLRASPRRASTPPTGRRSKSGRASDGVSQSCETPEISSSVAYARDAARSPPGSPTGRLGARRTADHALVTAAGEERSVAANVHGALAAVAALAEALGAAGLERLDASPTRWRRRSRWRSPPRRGRRPWRRPRLVARGLAFTVALERR